MTISNVASRRMDDGSDAGFEFTDKDFNTLREIAYKLTGISLAEHKRDLVYARLSKRLRAHGLTRFSDYRKVLESDQDGEIELFTNAITTNLTSFFREEHHFSYLQDEIVPQLLARCRSGNPVRIWSAGCSTGEEPYSIAMTLRESIPNIDSMDIRILATDLDTDVVRHAQRGVYDEARIDGIDPKYKRYFMRGKGANQGKVRVSDKLKKLITFEPLNLMGDWPMNYTLDIIFCRNVIIYFDIPTQQKLFARYSQKLHPEGRLFIGHSETLHKVCTDFELIERTVYRKVK